MISCIFIGITIFSIQSDSDTLISRGLINSHHGQNSLRQEIYQNDDKERIENVPIQKWETGEGHNECGIGIYYRYKTQ